MQNNIRVIQNQLIREYRKSGSKTRPPVAFSDIPMMIDHLLHRKVMPDERFLISFRCSQGKAKSYASP